MDATTRRDVLKLGVAAGAALLAAKTGAAAEPTDDGMRPLSEAVEAFNEWAAGDRIGKGQPVLTEDEVIAAIRWAMLDRSALPISEETRRALPAAAETRRLPAGFVLESLNGYEPNDRVTFDVWSVRLRVPREPDGTTAITIRERMLRSRLIGPRERAVIQAWQEKDRARGGSVGSFERVEYMRRYRQERAEAAARDRSEPE